MLDDTPDTPPPKTDATDAYAIPRTHERSSDTDLEDALDTLGRPDAVTLEQVREVADEALSYWLKRHKVTVGHRMAGVGYAKIANPRGNGGGWSVRSKNTLIFARRALTLEGRIAAAKAFIAANKCPNDGGGHAKIPDANMGHRARAAKSTQSPISASEPAGTAERPQGQLE